MFCYQPSTIDLYPWALPYPLAAKDSGICIFLQLFLTQPLGFLYFAIILRDFIFPQMTKSCAAVLRLLSSFMGVQGSTSTLEAMGQQETEVWELHRYIDLGGNSCIGCWMLTYMCGSAAINPAQDLAQLFVQHRLSQLRYR